MDQPGVIVFDVLREDEGGFSAHAQVGMYSMHTQGDTLDELHSMIADLISDYNSRKANRITGYGLLFNSVQPTAA